MYVCMYACGASTYVCTYVCMYVFYLFSIRLAGAIEHDE